MNAECGMRNGEWGMGNGTKEEVRVHSIPHSPFPIPHSAFPIPHSAFRIRLFRNLSSCTLTAHPIEKRSSVS